MKKIIFILLVFLCQKSIGQVYQLMPQYGYQANRFVFDSTLQIPTFCGVPTLKSVQFVTKKAAIAFDSCNNRFYQYNPKTLAWSVVSGGGSSTDTTSLSNRINLKLDSVKRRIDSVFGYRNGTEVFQFKDSIGGGSSVANDTAKVVIAKVHNATGTTLQRGEVVYLFGANGDVASVKRANNKQDSTSSKTFGIVRRDIVAGDTGYITTQGQIEKLVLGSYTTGDILWLDSIDGKFTKFKPVAPYHQVFIGVVERANNGNGLAYVKPQNGYELGELHNVSVNGNPNNAILYFDSTNRLWRGKVIDSFAVPKTDTTSLSNRINTKLTISDTSVFQRKLIAANSIQGNNTSAAANATNIFYKDTSGSYTGTITWNGTAPTTATNTYRWTRIGKMVTLNISLVYSIAGSANSTLNVTLPSDCPTPVEPTGLTANSTFIYPIYVKVFSSYTALTALTERAAFRKNSAGNGYEINIATGTGTTAVGALITLIYYTN